MYLYIISIISGILILLFLAWLALKVVKTILKTLIWCSFLIFLFFIVTSFFYDQDVRNLDEELSAGTIKIIYLSKITELSNIKENIEDIANRDNLDETFNLSESVLIIDDFFIESYLSMNINGSNISGNELSALFSMANSITPSELTELISKSKESISVALLIEPETKGYELSNFKSIKFARAVLPKFILRFLNLLILPVEKEV